MNDAVLSRVAQESNPAVFCSPLLKRLGYGTGVSVYKQKRFTPRGGHCASPWVLKKVTAKARTGALVTKRLQREAEILKLLDHENIIKLKAIVNESSKLGISLEFGGRSLDTIHESRYETQQAPQDPATCLLIARDIVSALTYLHNEALVLHGDMKAGNVLFDEHKRITKICDFGVSMFLVRGDDGFLRRKDPQEPYIGSQLWTPIEVHESEQEKQEDINVTDRCDIWAFGLVIYEMLALRPPYMDCLPAEEDLDQSFAGGDEDCDGYSDTLDELLQTLIGRRPEVPENVPYGYQHLVELFVVCCEQDFARRPSAHQLSQAFQTLQL